MVTNKIKNLFKFIIFNICVSTNILLSQDHGINWILGFANKPDTSLFGRSILNFSTGSLKLTRNSGGYRFELGFENNSFSDIQGKLRFFYDGFRLGNAIDYSIVQNGDTLNPGIVWQTYNGALYPTSDASIFIPPITLDSILLLLHLPLDYVTGVNYPFSTHLNLTKININSNDGKGKVISKNESILSATLSPIVLSACKHSNGRDWWLICKNNQGPEYYKILLMHNRIFKIDSQVIGESILDYSIVGNSIFSPNGKKFVRISNLDGLQIFDFDRCEGILSNYTTILNDSFKLGENSISVNVAISEDSRFLYASTSTKIFQYDLNAVNIENSMEIIGEWDGFIYKNSFTTQFCNLQLAPDGKIYVSCSSGNIFLHVIEKPDLKGKDSAFKLRGVTLPTNIACGLGNYPNYLLGPEQGSICDSLTTTYTVDTNEPFHLFPNPSDGILRIEGEALNYYKTIEISVFDISGTSINNQFLDGSLTAWTLNFDYLKAGLYFIEIKLDGKLVQTFKWVRN